MRESVVESHLVQRVKQAGGEIRKVQWIGRRGAPDRVVMMPPRGPVITAADVKAYREEHGGTMMDAKAALLARTKPGRTVWVELKRPGAVPEPHQEREHARLRAAGQRVVVLDSIAAVDAFVDAL